MYVDKKRKQEKIDFVNMVIRKNSKLTIKWKHNIWTYVVFITNLYGLELRDLDITEEQKLDLKFKYFTKKNNYTYIKENKNE